MSGRARQFGILGLLAMILATAAWPAVAAMDPADLCGIETRRLEQERGIPDGLLTAISLVESGRWDRSRGASFAWPYTVMAEGRGRFLPNKAAAIAEVVALRARGVKNIDVGCMQINLQAHPNAFADLNAAFDPRANVDYAAKFLLNLFEETRSWATAGTHYHSRTPVKAAAYRTKLALAWNKTQDGGSAALGTRRAYAVTNYADSPHVRVLKGAGAATANSPAPGAMPVVYHGLNDSSLAQRAAKLEAERAAVKEKTAAERAQAKKDAQNWRQEKLAEWYVRKIKRD
jgi:hypothetical protein